MKTIKLFSLSLILLSLLLVLSCSSDGDSPPDTIMEMTGNDDDDPIDNEDNILSGEFVDDAHPTSGMATVNEDRTLLTLTNFKSDSGPVLELYISTDTAASDYVSIAVLTDDDLEGDFTYDLPSGINFETHRYILVWCVDFSVNFGYAYLE